jgi:hypothetical protein
MNMNMNMSDIFYTTLLATDTNDIYLLFAMASPSANYGICYFIVPF